MKWAEELVKKQGPERAFKIANEYHTKTADAFYTQAKNWIKNRFPKVENNDDSN